MSKVKSTYFCQNCGAQSPQWAGKCPSCNEWNTLIEEVIQKDDSKTPQWESQNKNGKRTSVPLLIKEIDSSDNQRISINENELNRTLGGGIVPGSVILIGGEPGIGKSTLMLQLALKMKQSKILYISGEESEQQIKMRAERLEMQNDECYILTETSTQNIFQHVVKIKPDILIIDSIQTLHSAYIESAAGSVSQIRQCAAELINYAKQTATPVFLIGHINKDGQIAGPKILEHMVDTVLQFEGDQHNAYRILRTTKNRYGSTAELGIYEMRDTGLREIINPSEILISQREEDLSGIAVAATIEGMRPLLIETQALVSSAAYGTPQRSANGFDSRRMNMLLAVLEKRCGFKIAVKDVFLNIAGGIRVEDPAIDLAVVCSILSSHENISVSSKICFTGEVGLTGEIRAISRVEKRILEAEKLGFQKIYISKYNQKGMDLKRFNIEIIMVKKIDEVFSLLFG